MSVRKKGPAVKIKAVPIARASAKQHKQESSAPEEHLPPTYSPYLVVGTLGKPKEFYETTSKILIRRVITDVVKHEGPISLGLATRRVAAHWGINRIYKKAMDWVSYLLPSDDVLVSTSVEGVLLWVKGTNPDAYDIFRVPSDDPDSIRDPEDLPVCEIANAALFILRRHIDIGAPEEEIVREVSHLFGFRRTGTHVEKRMLAGVTFLVKKGVARREGTTVILEER